MIQDELEQRRQSQKKTGYIAVDLDGTLVEYHGWVAWNVIGPPIPAMVERVKAWLKEGYKVKIFTARLVADQNPTFVATCYKTGQQYLRYQMQDVISDWCLKHIGKRLEVINVKCLNMIELWDDRAIQVVSNTGRTLAEEHAAELEALKGAP
jgi:hypothetical protein